MREDSARPDGLTLTLVRHGRTEFNVSRLLQGWCDSPLTSEGIEGVTRTAQYLSDRRFDAAYVSPLGRTITTAQEILAFHPSTPKLLDDDLRELSFGHWEERPEEEVFAEIDPYALFEGILRGEHQGFPGGESGAAFMSRVERAFSRIEASHPTGDVLVVSHGVTLMAYLVSISLQPIVPLTNGSVSRVHIGPSGERTVLETGLNVAHAPVDDYVEIASEAAHED